MISELKLLTALLLILALASVAVFQVCQSPFTMMPLQGVLPNYGVSGGLKELAAPIRSIDSNELCSHDQQGASTLKERGHYESLELEPTTPHTRPHRHGYVLDLHHPGHQRGVLKAFTSLQCSIGSFGLPMYVVEPFIDFPQLNEGEYDTSSRMGGYFDVDHFNAVSRNLGYAELATYEEFLQKAPRNIVLLEIPSLTIGPRIPPIVTWSANDSSTCRHIPTVDNVLKKHGFCVVKTILVHKNREIMTLALTEEELYAQVFGEWNPEETTLIVTNWCDGCYILNPKLHPPNMCEQAPDQLSISEAFHPSQKIAALAKMYEEIHLGPDHHFGAAAMLNVHNLIEMFGTTDEQHSGINACFQDLVNLVRDLQEDSLHPQTFVSADIGRYASSSLEKSLKLFNYSEIGRKQLFGAVKRTLHSLTNTTNEEWENSFSIANDAVKDLKYISALQRTIAGQCECLIIVGGGQFLMLPLHDYLRNHPDPGTWCVHFVCLNPEYKHLYDRVLETKKSMYYWKPYL